MGKIMILKQGGAGVTQFQNVGQGAPKASALWNTMTGKTGATGKQRVGAGLGLGGKVLAAGLAAQTAGTRMQAGNSLRPLTQVGLDYEATDPTAQMQRAGIVPQNKDMQMPQQNIQPESVPLPQQQSVPLPNLSPGMTGKVGINQTPLPPAAAEPAVGNVTTGGKIPVIPAAATPPAAAQQIEAPPGTGFDTSVIGSAQQPQAAAPQQAAQPAAPQQPAGVQQQLPVAPAPVAPAAQQAAQPAVQPAVGPTNRINVSPPMMAAHQAKQARMTGPPQLGVGKWSGGAGPTPYTQEAPAAAAQYGDTSFSADYRMNQLNQLRPQQPAQAAQAAQPAQPAQPLQPAQPTNPSNDAAMYTNIDRMGGKNIKGVQFQSDAENRARAWGTNKSEMTLANVFAINAMHILGDGIFAKSPESVGFTCANMYLKSR